MKDKKKKQKRILILLIICVPILLVLLILTIRCIVHFPARPAWAIEQYFLRNTPIGSSYDEVYTFLNSCDKCEHIAINEEYGIMINSSNFTTNTFFATEKNSTDEFLQSRPWLKVIGVKAIEVDVGDCDFPLPYTVLVYFAFDEDGKLIKVCYDKVNGWP